MKNIQKDKLLIFVSNIYASLLMSTYLIQKKKLNENVFIIIEKRYPEGRKGLSSIDQNLEIVKKIFLKIGFKNIYLYERPKTYESFFYKNLFNFWKSRKINQKYKKKLDTFLESKKIDANLIKEVWFTNDLISKLFLFNFNKKKIYFFHGLGDIMILKKKSFIETLYVKLKYFVNIYLYNIYFSYNKKNVEHVNLFSNGYNKLIFHNTKTIDAKIYKKILLKVSSSFKKLKFKKKVFLISDNINLTNFTAKQAKIHSKYYVECLIKHLNKKNKYTTENTQFLIKWKKTYKPMHLKIFINEFKKYGIVIKNLDDLIGKFIPIEFILSNIKPKIVTSNYSTINFIISRIYPGIKILNTKNIYHKFNTDYLNYHHKNNLKLYLDNSERLKEILNKIPYHENILIN
jgi:hypothetical protein